MFAYKGKTKPLVSPDQHAYLLNDQQLAEFNQRLEKAPEGNAGLRNWLPPSHAGNNRRRLSLRQIIRYNETASVVEWVDMPLQRS